ncbi:MAG: hypothetical protein JRI95_08685 [Deltaproteobacteria bacterium]|nr:hypothetical protein [Deltaproteobacteria bacterium]MBW2084480.1 hypothetical protein [Deltaproteobacteria bacterium]
MLFLLNKTRPNVPDLITLLGGAEEKELLLVGDGVFYATPFMLEKFKAAGVSQIYASGDSLEDRGIEVSDECALVDYDKMVSLIMEEHDKTISL